MSGNTREFITKCYRNLLHREPDIPGLEFYFKKIKNKEISEEQLLLIFRESDEFKQIQRKREKFDINYFEKKIYSQNGEDGIIEFIFEIVDTKNKFFVEIGVEDGHQCNTRNLLTKGWKGIMIDANSTNTSTIKKEFVTSENVNELFEKYSVPNSFDLLSIDIDYNTYWVWKAITKYLPRVVAIEYNSTIPCTESLVVEYDPLGKWDGTNYFGASLLALKKLGDSKGYTLVGCDSFGVNAFFVKNELINEKIKIRSIEELFKPPKFGRIVNGIYVGHSISNKQMISV